MWRLNKMPLTHFGASSHVYHPCTKPIETKFHGEPPWDKGTKTRLNGLDHMTKMAAMPINCKRSLEPKGR